MKQSVKTYLEGMLDNPNDTKSWIMIYAVAKDLPIYKDLQELCFDVLKTSTANSLFQEGIENPAFTFFAAASQAINFGDENLTANFREKVLETFRKLEADGNFNENAEVRAILMDAALALSYVPYDALKSNERFRAMVDKIQNEWRDFTVNFGHAFHNTFWNLPVVDGDIWRYLNLRIRSLKGLNAS